MGIGGMGSGGSMRDPMRNAGLSAQFMDYENKRNNKPVSDRQRKLAYVLMAVIGVALVSVIVLFAL